MTLITARCARWPGWRKGSEAVSPSTKPRGIRSHPGGSPPIPAVGGDDRERRRQRRGGNAVHHIVEDHPGHIPHRSHRGPDARGNGALAGTPFFQQFAGAGLITLVAAGITEAAAQGVTLFVGVDPTLVVVGGIVMLVAGMAIVGAAQDAIDQFYVTASARLLDVAMRTAGIVVGIVASLELAWLLGAPLSISPDPVALGPLGAQFVGATLTSAFFALWAYADLATIALAGAMGLLGWAGYALMIYVGANEVPANTTGAFVAALASTLLIRRTSIPGFGLVSAALLPLVPGLALYNGLLQVVGTPSETANPGAGGSTLLLALGVALGLAAGATLGTYLGRPIADQLRRIPLRPRRGRSTLSAERQKSESVGVGS